MKTYNELIQRIIVITNEIDPLLGSPNAQEKIKKLQYERALLAWVLDGKGDKYED